MPKLPEQTDGEPNMLLGSLPRDAYQRLVRHGESVSLVTRQEIFEPDKPIDYVYFPRAGVLSLLITMRNGAAVEAATVGKDGMVGIGVFLEAVHIHLKAICQVPGEALRIKADVFRRDVEKVKPLHTLLHRYTQALMIQFTQGVACNRLHTVEQRCARWLLMTHDRVETDEFPLTQEFLAQMLGVRRASVTVVAGMLQDAGLIRYSRGRITVLDRKGLEKQSCECYAVVRQELERLVNGNQTSRERRAR